MGRDSSPWVFRHSIKGFTFTPKEQSHTRLLLSSCYRWGNRVWKWVVTYPAQSHSSGWLLRAEHPSGLNIPCRDSHWRSEAALDVTFFFFNSHFILLIFFFEFWGWGTVRVVFPVKCELAQGLEGTAGCYTSPAPKESKASGRQRLLPLTTR